ncbi:MAG: Fic family protein [Myxococcales bacterium]|nr:Fic family protein [Myxococcales bacterium]
MRKYERTHQWLKFQVNLQDASPRLWLMLGEAQSKCAHIAGVPLDRPTAEKIHYLYLAKGVLATTAIEGNTLSEEEVRRRIEGSLKLPPSKEYLGQEIDNIVATCNRILGEMLSGKATELTVDLLCDLNRSVLANLPLESHVVPGRIRQVGEEVVVGAYRGAPGEDCRYLLERLCGLLNDGKKTAPADEGLAAAIVRAIVAHLYLAWIHPFADGNGRTARLVEFLILLDAGMPTPAAHLLSNHYNQTRQIYYRQLHGASASGGDILPFIEYAVRGLVDSLQEQLATIRDYQWRVIWRDYVYRIFRDSAHRVSGAVRGRERDLVLALSDQLGFVPLSKIPHLTPELAATYATKTRKTVSRDVNTAVELGLLEKTADGVRARTETILAFLPARKMK